MKIGFDLDKVFINTPPLIPDIIIDHLYKKKTSNKLQYRIPNKPEQLLRRATHMPPFRPPIKENIAALELLHTKENKLYLISSRFSFLESSTTAVIKKYSFSQIFTKMYFNYANEQPHVFKAKIIKSLALDKYVDDDFQLLTYVAKQNPKTLFFWYNKHHTLKKITDNIYAISSIKEISQPL